MAQDFAGFVHRVAHLGLVEDEVARGGHRGVGGVFASFLVRATLAALDLLAEGKRPGATNLVESRRNSSSFALRVEPLNS